MWCLQKGTWAHSMTSRCRWKELRCSKQESLATGWWENPGQIAGLGAKCEWAIGCISSSNDVCASLRRVHCSLAQHNDREASGDKTSCHLWNQELHP